MQASLCRGDGGFRMQRMRRANENGLRAALANHSRDVSKWFAPVSCGKLFRAIQTRITNGDQGGFRQSRKGGGVKSTHLSTTNESGWNRFHPRGEICFPKYCSTIRRRNASDSAISSIPFIPSSMLIQPV